MNRPVVNLTVPVYAAVSLT